MYLKRLEIQGFKSLADKIELQLQPGIAAIVGPNGCGKSNIADAIRWVLGEQSAKNLRGAKMEDVIFAGSDKRKQVGMAEVSMTIDNSDGHFPIDFSEVTVTRRVYRSGESEFFINKAACRLKDIHELFMDTGIGREGYSIISQGKIDEILNVRSEERRMIIEEAAGIVKYKSRKLQAVKKLNDTEQNLVRIHDIISELSNQVGPLGEQAEKATEYLALKTELEELEVNMLTHQIGEQKIKLEEINNQDEKVKLELIQSETGLHNIESQLEQEKLDITKLDETISAYQQQVFDAGTLLEKKEADIRIGSERIANSQRQQTDLHNEVVELEEKHNIEKTRHTGDEETLKNIRNSIHDTQKKLASLEEGLTELDQRISEDLIKHENDKADIIEIMNQTAQIKNQIHNAETAIATVERRKQHNSEQIASLEQELEAAKKSLNQCLDQMEHISGEIRLKTQHGETLRQEKQQTEIEIEQATKKLMDTQRFHNDRSSRLKALQDMQNEFDGYFRGVKEVMVAAKKGKLAGICGAVAELMKVIPKYETAIEVSLGGALQNIVTETDSAAKEAIEFLKNNRAGRATFLPLNTVKGGRGKATSEIAKCEGFVGMAAELVEYDSKYAKVIDHLLGGIAVAKNIRDAMNMARVTGQTFKIVTLDGDVVNPGGAMTGGHYQKNNSGLLSRNREIDDLAKEIASLADSISVQTQDLQKLKDKLRTNQSDYEENNAQMNTLNLELTSLRKEAESFDKEKNRIQGTLTMVKEELTFMDREMEENQGDVSKYSGQMKELVQKDLEVRQNIESAKEYISEQEKHRENFVNQITSIKVELAKLQQEEVNYAQIMGRVMEALSDVESQISRKKTQINELENTINGIHLEIAGWEKEIVELQQDKGQKEETLNDLRNKKQASSAFISDKEAVLRQVSKDIDRLKDQVHSSDVKKARLEFEIENSLAKLIEEFHCTFEEALLRKTETINKKEVGQRIRELKNLIVAIGDVNVGAIEEFARVKERYEFLSLQYADLENAKASLFKVIEEMDQIMTERFGKAFHEINESFTEVFTRLFGGGRAQLILTDANNLLESGIEIVAQPPGKKNQYLSLLSGGEKALTAIALLLAILQNKPSPFCVLDEIEAALDEANVDRYAAFLKDFCHTTQFIVITHRKGTMEAADSLYGVTMDESRVTKLVSMKLTDAIEKVS